PCPTTRRDPDNHQPPGPERSPAPRALPAFPEGTSMTTFAKRLRQLRKQKGWTTYKLAQECKISRPGLDKLERPGADPKLSTMIKLAAALGVKVRDLIPEEEEPRT